MKLELLVGDTKRQEKNVMVVAFRHVQRGSVALIGPETCDEAILVSRWLALPSIDRALIGHSATSPQLSEPEFSNFLRTPPSDRFAAQAMTKLMKGLLVAVESVFWILEKGGRAVFSRDCKPSFTLLLYFSADL